MNASTEGRDATLTFEGDSPRERTPAPAPHLFVIWAGGHPFGARHSLADVDAVEIGRSRDGGHERSAGGSRERLRLRFDDPWMSSAHAQIVRRDLHFVVTDQGSKNGVFVGDRRVRETVLRDRDVLRCGNTFMRFRDRLVVDHDAPADLSEAQLPAETGLRTLLPALRRQFEEVVAIARSQSPVLIRGPTGSGKELLAEAIHARSGRSGPLIPINCGALAPNLVESELFGHRKGAFSGAEENREGLVQASAGGTLFLDEVGELPLPAQAALLRALQDGEVRPIGSAKPKKIDLRVIAATNRDLEGLVAGDRFRRDLYGRLAGYVVRLPPLVRRTEDFGVIAGSISRARSDPSTLPRFSPDVVRALLAHPWPQNARELDHVLRRATTLAARDTITTEHLPPELLNPGPLPSDLDAPVPEDARRRQLIGLLEEHGGNISAVARTMGKVRSQVQRWLKRYGIEASDYRSDR